MAAGEQERSQRARARILDAAADAFMLQGFRETTVDDIAESIGATKGLVYYHFRSKFDIFLAVYEHGMEHARHRVEPHSRTSASARERLLSMASAHLLNLMDYPGYHQAIHQGVREQRSAALKARQRSSLIELNILREDYEKMFRSVIEDGIAEGSLRDADSSLMTRTLLSSLNAVDNWYQPREHQEPESLQPLAENIVDLLINGLTR